MNDQTKTKTENEPLISPSLLNGGLAAIAYMLYLETWLNPDETFSELGDEELHSLYEKWITQWIPALSEPHCGDCTKVSATCIRCSVEQFYTDAARIMKVANKI